MKVKYFYAYSGNDLEDKINNFCKKHEVVQISYSVVPAGYKYCHECMVLYRD